MADVLSTMRRKKTTLKKFFEDAGVSSLSDAKKHLQDLGYDLPDDRTLRHALPKKVHKPVVKKVEVTAPQKEAAPAQPKTTRKRKPRKVTSKSE